MPKRYFGRERMPNDASLADLKRAYTFLNVKLLHELDEAEERQIYLFMFTFFVFVRSAFVALICCGMAVAAVLLLTSETLDSPRLTGLLAIWPPNGVLRDRLVAHFADDPSYIGTVLNLSRVLAAITASHVTWLIWLLWWIRYEASTNEYLSDRPGTGIIYVFVFAAICSWGAVLIVPNSDYAFNAPGFLDRADVMSIKMSVLMSLAYFLTGVILVYSTTSIRRYLRNRG